jgi:DNA-directed RNA polymerase subunit RPC12/RpoP
MPCMHCSGCRRTAWLHPTDEREVDCRHCGSPLTVTLRGDPGPLASAVRERFERDMRRDAGRVRFVRG